MCVACDDGFLLGRALTRSRERKRKSYLPCPTTGTRCPPPGTAAGQLCPARRTVCSSGHSRWRAAASSRRTWAYLPPRTLHSAGAWTRCTWPCRTASSPRSMRCACPRMSQVSAPVCRGGANRPARSRPRRTTCRCRPTQAACVGSGRWRPDRRSSSLSAGEAKCRARLGRIGVPTGTSRPYSESYSMELARRSRRT